MLRNIKKKGQKFNLRPNKRHLHGESTQRKKKLVKVQSWENKNIHLSPNLINYQKEYLNTPEIQSDGKLSFGKNSCAWRIERWNRDCLLLPWKKRKPWLLECFVQVRDMTFIISLVNSEILSLNTQVELYSDQTIIFISVRTRK